MTYDVSLLECVSAPVFALASGKDGTFLAWNKALSRVTGIASEDALGRTPDQVLGPKAKGVSQAPPGLFQVPQLGLVVVERQETVLIGTLQDAERDTYIGMAAHDLRAPLRNVLYLAEMALADGGNPEIVGKIAGVARGGLSLTSDIVICAQSLGLGEQPLQDVALQPLATQIVSTLETTELDVECPSVMLHVEKPVLTIVLRNLMDNAVRHGGHGLRRIAISAVPCEAGIEVRVADNGKGFKDSSLAFLAGGEFRLESGYGLMGLRRLLQSRGGRIRVEPAETGKGSAVVVTLPGTVGGAERIAIAS